MGKLSLIVLVQRRGALLSVLLLATIFFGLAADLSRYHAFWSPDCGARFAGIRSWLETGAPVPLRYPFAGLDPAGRFHPLAGYLGHARGALCLVYPPLFLAASGAGYRLWGFPGLAVLPLTAGLCCAWLIHCLAHELRLRSAPLLPLVAGLATPLLIYSVIFWDHSLQMCVTAAAAYAVWRCLKTESYRWAAVAGALLGVGLWIHEVFIPLFIAAALAALPYRKAAPGLLRGLTTGFGALALAWMAGNWLLYGSPAGAHLMGPNDPTHPDLLRLTLDPAMLMHRVQDQLAGDPAEGDWVRLELLLLTLYLGVSNSRSLRAWMPPLQVALAGVSLGLLFRAPWAHGLFSATPLFVLGLAQARPLLDDLGTAPDSKLSPRERFFRWAAATSVLFTAAVLVNPKTPEMNWGSRYLLTVLPLLVLAAAAALETRIAAGGRARTPMIASGVALLAVSLFSQYRGILAVREDLRASRELIQAVAATASPVVATDLFWLAPETAEATLHPKLLLVPEDDAGRSAFLSLLRRADAGEFTYVGSEAGLVALERLAAPPAAPLVRGKQELRAGLLFTQFVLARQPERRPE